MKRINVLVRLLQFVGAVFVTALVVVMFGCQIHIAGEWLPWMWLMVIIIALLVLWCKTTWEEYKEEAGK